MFSLNEEGGNARTAKQKSPPKSPKRNWDAIRRALGTSSPAKPGGAKPLDSGQQESRESSKSRKSSSCSNLTENQKIKEALTRAAEPVGGDGSADAGQPGISTQHKKERLKPNPIESKAGSKIKSFRNGNTRKESLPAVSQSTPVNKAHESLPPVIGKTVSSPADAIVTSADALVLAEVRLTDLDKKNAIQCRAKLNCKQVKQYKERMQANDKFPPIEVFRIDGVLCITDGLHRVKAALELGLETILCGIRNGNRTDAIKAALQANGSHGLPRSNADKHHAVKLALESFPNLSHHQIAELCTVSQPFVSGLYRQLKTVIGCGPTMGRDGKMRRLPTKRKSQTPEAPKSEAAATDQAGEGDAESQPTRAVSGTRASSEGDDQTTSPDESNPPVVRQEVVQAVVEKIKKLIFTETEGLVEAEIIAVFEGVKQFATFDQAT